MSKLLAVGLLAGLAVVSTASAANLVTNGDFASNTLTGWTEYHSGWTVTAKTNYDATPGHAQIYSATNYFWADEILYQAVTLAASTKPYAYSIDWSGKVGNNGWAAVFAFTQALGTSAATIGDNIDNSKNGYATIVPQVGAGLTIAPATLTGQVTATTSKLLIIGIKLGSYPESTNNTILNMDNVSVTLTPEPGTLALLALGLPMLRRRR